MSRAAIKFLPLALLALLAGDGGAEPGQLPIWVIGDSVGVGIEGALVRAGYQVRRQAENSTTARQWVERLRTILWPRSAHCVVVSLGTNDAQSAELRREFDTNASQIVAMLKSRGHRVIWVLPPSPQSSIPGPLNLERLLQLGITVIHERVDMSDTWHPTAAGYDQLARTILGVRAK